MPPRGSELWRLASIQPPACFNPRSRAGANCSSLTATIPSSSLETVIEALQQHALTHRPVSEYDPHRLSLAQNLLLLELLARTADRGYTDQHLAELVRKVIFELIPADAPQSAKDPDPEEEDLRGPELPTPPPAPPLPVPRSDVPKPKPKVLSRDELLDRGGPVSVKRRSVSSFFSSDSDYDPEHGASADFQEAPHDYKN